MAIDAIKNIGQSSLSNLKSLDKSTDSKISFSKYLKNAISDTNKLLVQSDKMSAEFAAGRRDDIHQVLISAEKADIALQFTMQVRNKIMDAYNEIMRMQI